MDTVKTEESSTRQCGDRSDPFYKERRLVSFVNPPNGSLGIVQVRAIYAAATYSQVRQENGK
jgi:hypothetical protein